MIAACGRTKYVYKFLFTEHCNAEADLKILIFDFNASMVSSSLLQRISEIERDFVRFYSDLLLYNTLLASSNSRYSASSTQSTCKVWLLFSRIFFALST